MRSQESTSTWGKKWWEGQRRLYKGGSLTMYSLGHLNTCLAHLSLFMTSSKANSPQNVPVISGKYCFLHFTYNLHRIVLCCRYLYMYILSPLINYKLISGRCCPLGHLCISHRIWNVANTPCVFSGCLLSERLK